MAEIKKQKKRSEIKDVYKWRLEDLYATDADWVAEYDTIRVRIDSLNEFKDRLSDKLFECIQLGEELDEKVSRLYLYSHMRMHEDGTNTFYQGLADKSENLNARFGEAYSFVVPEILTLSDAVIAGFLKEHPVYAHFIDDILRTKEHVLSPEMEELLASAQEMIQSPENIFAMLTNADMKFGSVKDDDGDEIELTLGRYNTLLESGDRGVRKAAFETLYDSFLKQKNTIGATYNASVKTDLFTARARKYNSCMEASLADNNIPVAIYENLIKTVNKSLPLMHRYVRLRKERLGLAEIHYYDMYTPIAQTANAKISFDEAKETVYNGLHPLGDDYRALLRRGFNESWIDVYENEGKHSGAYSWGVFGIPHPYVLLNYENRLNDVFTLAHEMGHAVHSYLTEQNQPRVYGDHSIFLAEIASTTNEALLIDHLLKNTKDRGMKAYLLDYYLNQFRTTLFRQTMFAEFEMITHQRAENDEPLTIDTMRGLYAELLAKHYGPDMVLDEQIKMEWARISHFYSAFYVYQYATGFSAANALSGKIIAEGKPAADRYIKNLLCAGSSDYSIEILKNAGVDMSTPEPIERAMVIFENLLEQAEKLDDRRGSAR